MKRILFTIGMAAALQGAVAFGQSWTDGRSGGHKPPDIIRQPAYAVGLTFVSGADVEGADEVSITGFDGSWDLAYFQNALRTGADVDFSLNGHLLVFSGSGGVELPNQVGSVTLGMGALWRYVGGSSLDLRARPGVYSDFEDFSSDTLFFPFSVTVGRQLNDQLDGFLGLDVRPRFERTLVPIVGLDWHPADRLQVRAGFPDSRLVWYAASVFVPYAGLSWDSTTYAIKDAAAYRRDEFTFEAYRLYGGFRMALTEEFSFAAEIGQEFHRSFEFDKATEATPRHVSPDDALAVRFALLGPF